MVISSTLRPLSCTERKLNFPLSTLSLSANFCRYFVATAYSGDANGHFGDAIQYVSDAGKLQQIEGASSTWGNYTPYSLAVRWLISF